MTDNCSPILNPTMATAPLKFSKPGQVQVIFRSVEETYPVGVDVQCMYTVNGSMEISSRDWVGLYKVGWRSQSDYFYYDWAPMPQDYVKGKDFEGKIVFPAHKLPKDDGEFYQFCYVTTSGQVRGASTPFQFRQTSMDDLIEIEDENGELLVIKTKTALLEEKLKKANELKVTMKQQIQALENERSLLLATERQLQRKLQQQKEEQEALREKLEEAGELNNEQRLQLEHLQVCITASQEKTEILNQEKATMEKRLDENDAYIVSLQEKIKTLVNEKDALTGRIRSLEDEGEQLRGFVMDNDRLRTRLMEEEICGARMKKEVERMEEEIQEQQVRLEKQLQTSTNDKETIDFLYERIRNAEDKLSAAEHCKMMLNEEVLTMRQAFEKMSSNLEEEKVATDSIRKTLCSTEQNLSMEIKCLNEEKRVTEEKLEVLTKEKSELSEQLAKLQECLDEKSKKQKSEAEGSLYALEMAQATLKERYMKMSKKCEANQRALENALCRVHELEMTLDDQKLEVDDLKERLQMAEEAYKEKFIECEILEGRLLKQQRRASCQRLDSNEISEGNVAAGPCKSDNLEMVPDSEIQQQLKAAVLKAAVENYRSKAKKYEKLYIEQKLQNEEMTKKLMERDEDFSLMKEMWIKPCAPPNDECTKNSDFSNQRSFDGTSESSARSLESFDAMDGSGMAGMMPAPLRPLPPPMMPAKVGKVPAVACSASSGQGKANTTWDVNSLPDMTVDGVDSGHKDLALHNISVDGERYEDAPDEPQRTCPVCSYVFSYESTEAEIIAHVEEDLCRVCPICSAQFPDNQLREFEVHVNKHFESS